MGTFDRRIRKLELALPPGGCAGGVYVYLAPNPALPADFSAQLVAESNLPTEPPDPATLAPGTIVVAISPTPEGWFFDATGQLAPDPEIIAESGQAAPTLAAQP